jgi:DNA-binding NtrC family response regulator
VPFTYSELDGTRPTQVLIVDDDEDVRRVTRVLLSLEGFDVVEAGSAYEAIARFDALPSDVVVTDLFLAGEGGIQLVQDLRHRRPSVPIVAISGEESECLPVALLVAASLSAVVVLEKPFGGDDLVAAIRRALQIGS